jgi:tRNA(Arg) A34 adenosine deaminase TadA
MHIPCCKSRDKAELFPDKIEAVEILSQEYYRDCSETIDFLALCGVEGKLIEKSVQIINRISPINTKFNYLKRIKGSTVLICPPQPDSSIGDSILKALGEVDLLTPDMLIDTIQVPAFPALTFNQYKVANKIWPVRVTTPLVDENFRDMERNSIHCKHLNRLLSEKSDSACIFISPDTKIEAVGIYPSNELLQFRHCVFDACERIGPIADYLATDFTVYCAGEPCLMCCMALLHSRVKEVIFLDSREERNFHGFTGPLAVHCNPQLNHRFRVFKVSRTNS